MSPAVGVVGAIANVAILLTLAAAVASPKASPLLRPVIATLAFVCAWAIAAVLDAVRAPGWAIDLGEVVIVVSIVVTIATLHLWTQEGDDAHRGAGRRGDDDGGGPHGRRRSPDGGGGGPDWWPEFERQLAAQVAERETPEVCR